MYLAMRKLNNIVYLIIGTIFISCSKSEDPSIAPATNVMINGVNKTEMLNLINSYRTKGCNCGTEVMPSVAKLIWNDKLGEAAIKHTKDMAANNYFSHTSQDGKSLVDRINAAGYTWFMLGENIAMGHTSEQQVMEGWINSPGHCKNIMNAGFTEVGFGRDKNYWTQNFGKPR